MLELGFSENLNAILRKRVVVEEFCPLKKWNMLLTIRDFAPNEWYRWPPSVKHRENLWLLCGEQG